MSQEVQKIPKTGMIVEMPSFMESDKEDPTKDQNLDEEILEGQTEVPVKETPKSKVNSSAFDTLDLEDWLNKIFNNALKIKG